MLIGVVSDTHNNLKNIKTIISIFNSESVELVIHTGDITNSSAIAEFSNLNCEFLGVYGNNDRNEKGLKETVKEFSFHFQDPPLFIKKAGKKIGIFHEPEIISSTLEWNKAIDLILHGHTHRYRKELINDTLYFNPGESAGFLKGKNAIGVVNLENLETKRIFF
tara:strand:+ start:1152 stop:1643 length:492 start_codon:yes stop_codon:yes gene_type:complete